MGTPAFAVPALEALASTHEVAAVVTRPDRRRGRGRTTACSAVKGWALEAGVRVEQPATLRTAAARQSLAAHLPEVIVVVAYGLILPPEVLELPARGCINVHASLLPRHRGAAPVAWSILSGDSETGVTTMLMDEGLDTGPILLQSRLPIAAEDTGETLALRIAAAGAELLLETLEGLETGVVISRPQDDARATSAPSFTKQDGELDWSRPADELDRRVRGLQPWPGTFTFLEDERIGVWRVRAHTGAATDAVPGRVQRVTDEALWVACGNGDLLEIVELQRAGGRRQSAAEFLRGRRVAEGSRFAVRDASGPADA